MQNWHEVPTLQDGVECRPFYQALLSLCMSAHLVKWSSPDVRTMAVYRRRANAHKCWLEHVALGWCTKYRYKIFVTTQMRQLWPRSRARILLNELPHVQRLYRGKRLRSPRKFMPRFGYITLEKAKNTLRRHHAKTCH
jgi:REP element-mobilizing transposase RayT